MKDFVRTSDFKTFDHIIAADTVGGRINRYPCSAVSEPVALVAWAFHRELFLAVCLVQCKVTQSFANGSLVGWMDVETLVGFYKVIG